VTTQQTIEDKLRAALSPSHLEVINESHMHSVAPGSETHFKVVVVSDRFAGLSAVARHKLVYATLDAELKRDRGVHALAITSRTPAEWASAPVAHVSPNCHGGSKADAK
jgi:stress-induced morphogen